MTGRVIFLLEEPSMKALLDTFLPRLIPHWTEGTHFQCIPHEGKSDLDRSIQRKLLAWREPGVRFVIVRDNDNVNCTELKKQIAAQCAQAKRDDTLIRLVCQELESWYIGDLVALSKVFPSASVDTPRNRKRFSDPDTWQKPSRELRDIVPNFQKISAARAMGAQLSLNSGINTSRSFNIFVLGITRIAQHNATQPHRHHTSN